MVLCNSSFSVLKYSDLNFMTFNLSWVVFKRRCKSFDFWFSRAYSLVYVYFFDSNNDSTTLLIFLDEATVFSYYSCCIAASFCRLTNFFLVVDVTEIFFCLFDLFLPGWRPRPPLRAVILMYLLSCQTIWNKIPGLVVA